MTSTTWAPPTERLELVRAFMADRVVPNEQAIERQDEAGEQLLAELQDEVRALGLWAPHLPPEAGGSGTGFLDYAYLNEQIGRSAFGPSSVMTDIAPRDSSAPTSARPTSPRRACARPLPASIT